MNAAASWTSVDVARITVSALTPILLFVLSIVVTRAGRRFEDAQWANRRLVERRIELYDVLAPQLNDILCFFQCIGHFRTLVPPTVLEIKNSVDRTFFAYEPLLSEEFSLSYKAFTNACFGKGDAAGQPSRMKAAPQRIRGERGSSLLWDAAWDGMFDATKEDLRLQRDCYATLMTAFARDVGSRR